MEDEDGDEQELEGSATENTENELERLEGARHDNDLKLKRRFEDLFEKYEHDFADIGDEIDIITGEIVVNNGHLENMQDEVDPGTSESTSFLKSFQIIDISSEDDFNSGDESAASHGKSSHREGLSSDRRLSAWRDDFVPATKRTKYEETHRHLSAAPRPAPRLAALLASRERVNKRSTNSPSTASVRETSTLRTPLRSNGKSDNSRPALRMSESAHGIQESMRMLQARNNGQNLDPNEIQDLGIAIANQLAQLLSVAPRQDSTRLPRRPAARDQIWDCPEPGETPFPAKRRENRQPPRHVPLPSPGSSSLWAPVLQRKKRKRSQIPAITEAPPTSLFPVSPPEVRLERENALINAKGVPDSFRASVDLPQKFIDQRIEVFRGENDESFVDGEQTLFTNADQESYPSASEETPPRTVPQVGNSGDHSNYAANTSRHRECGDNAGSRFTVQEDALLIHLKENEQLPWSSMPLYFKNRSAFTLQHRYSKRLNQPCEGRVFLLKGALHDIPLKDPEDDPRLRADTAWSNSEDELLLDLREEQELDWSEISSRMPGQHSLTDIQKRYSLLTEVGMNQFNEKCHTRPSDRTSCTKQSEPFSSSEDALIIQLRDVQQLKWGEMQQYFPNRNFQALRRRYIKLRTNAQYPSDGQIAPNDVIDGHISTEDPGDGLNENQVPQTDSPFPALGAESAGPAPSQPRRPFRYTPFEDELIVKMKQSDCSWKEIERKLPGRNAISIRNRYDYMCSNGALGSHTLGSNLDHEDSENLDNYLDPPVPYEQSHLLHGHKTRNADGNPSSKQGQEQSLGRERPLSTFGEVGSLDPSQNALPLGSTSKGLKMPLLLTNNVISHRHEASREVGESRHRLDFLSLAIEDPLDSLCAKGKTVEETCKNIPDKAPQTSGVTQSTSLSKRAHVSPSSSARHEATPLRKAIDSNTRHCTITCQEKSLSERKGDSSTPRHNTPANSFHQVTGEITFSVPEESPLTSVRSEGARIDHETIVTPEHNTPERCTQNSPPFEPFNPRNSVDTLPDAYASKFSGQRVDNNKSHCLVACSPGPGTGSRSLSSNVGSDRDEIGHDETDERSPETFSPLDLSSKAESSGMSERPTQRVAEDMDHVVSTVDGIARDLPSVRIPAVERRNTTPDLDVEINEISGRNWLAPPASLVDPQLSWIQMINMAFNDIGPGPLRMTDIVQWIEAKFPSIAIGKPRWKMSIRSILIRNALYRPTTVDGKRAWLKADARSTPSQDAAASTSRIEGLGFHYVDIIASPLPSSPQARQANGNHFTRQSTRMQDSDGATSDETDISHPVETSSNHSSRQKSKPIKRSRRQHALDPQTDNKIETLSDTLTELPRRQYRRRRILSATVIRDSEDEEATLMYDGFSPSIPSQEPRDALNFDDQSGTPDYGDRPISREASAIRRPNSLSQPAPQKLLKRSEIIPPEVANSQSTAPSSSTASIATTLSDFSAQPSTDKRMRPPPKRAAAVGVPITPKSAFRRISGSDGHLDSVRSNDILSLTAHGRNTLKTASGRSVKRYVETPVREKATVDEDEDELA